MSYFAHAGQILISFAFGALVALLVLRVLLQYFGANFYNPVCQFLYKATNPVLMPLRRLMPTRGRLEYSGLLLAWMVSMLKLVLIYALAGQRLGLAGLALMALADLIDFVLTLYLGLILLSVLLSFVSLERSNPIVPLIHLLTEPVLRPLRRLLPQVGGFDLSPILAWLAILLLRVLIAAPILDFGLRAAHA